MIRKFAVEFLGTAILVYVACGVATLMFGFKFAGTSVAAGVVATALAFGLTLLALVYFIGPVSGSHVNPAVTIGALLTGRIPLSEAVGESRPEPRPGAGGRRHGPEPGLAVHRGAPGRRCARCGGCTGCS